MDSPGVLVAIDCIRAAAASQNVSVEDLRALVVESTELVEALIRDAESGA